MFADLTKTFIEQNCPMPFSRPIAILNNLYFDLPGSANVHEYHPFEKTKMMVKQVFRESFVGNQHRFYGAVYLGLFQL